jgi:hypothetical protein
MCARILFSRVLGLEQDRFWYQNLPDFARDLLSEKRINEKGYFDPNAVNALQKNIEKQVSFDREPLMAILQVQMWDDLFRSGILSLTMHYLLEYFAIICLYCASIRRGSQSGFNCRPCTDNIFPNLSTESNFSIRDAHLIVLTR